VNEFTWLAGLGPKGVDLRWSPATFLHALALTGSQSPATGRQLVLTFLELGGLT
jgi:hypothetical protein